MYILYCWSTSRPIKHSFPGEGPHPPSHPAHPKQAPDPHFPVAAWKWGAGCFNEIIPSESRTKMGIKPGASLLYQWFSTHSITKGILKVQGGLAKPSLSKPWNIPLPIKQTPPKSAGSCFATSGQAQLSLQWMRENHILQVWVGTFTLRASDLGVSLDSQWGKTSEDHTINKSSLAGVLLGWQVNLIEQTANSQNSKCHRCAWIYSCFSNGISKQSGLFDSRVQYQHSWEAQRLKEGTVL